jgi:hypothetical protein
MERDGIVVDAIPVEVRVDLGHTLHHCLDPHAHLVATVQWAPEVVDVVHVGCEQIRPRPPVLARVADGPPVRERLFDLASFERHRRPSSMTVKRGPGVRDCTER